MFCISRTKHTVQRSTSPEQLTAAKLIDAIITHQINQTSDDTLAAPRDGRPNFINVSLFYSQQQTYDIKI